MNWKNTCSGIKRCSFWRRDSSSWAWVMEGIYLEWISCASKRSSWRYKMSWISSSDSLKKIEPPISQQAYNLCLRATLICCLCLWANSSARISVACTTDEVDHSIGAAAPQRLLSFLSDDDINVAWEYQLQLQLKLECQIRWTRPLSLSIAE